MAATQAQNNVRDRLALYSSNPPRAPARYLHHLAGIRTLNHDKHNHTPAHLRVIGMAAWGDEDMAALANLGREPSRIWRFCDASTSGSVRFQFARSKMKLSFKFQTE